MSSRAPITTTRAAGVLRATYTYDAQGRVTDYIEKTADGYGRAYERKVYLYDNSGQAMHEETWTRSSDGKDLHSEIYTYYVNGLVTGSSTNSWVNGGSETSTSMAYGYVWTDAAHQSTITYTPDVYHPDDTNVSTYYYGINGALTQVTIRDGNSRTLYFATDAAGMIVHRDVNSANSAAPHETHYYFGGVEEGAIGNDGANASNSIDYAGSIAAHQAHQDTGLFRNGATSGVSYADFDVSYNPVNGLVDLSSTFVYTVGQGDTLQSIAQAVYGDASLWYLIAEQNGLSAGDTLVAGTSLRLTSKAQAVHNTSSTYQEDLGSE